jgi:hypothetical protein
LNKLLVLWKSHYMNRISTPSPKIVISFPFTMSCSGDPNNCKQYRTSPNFFYIVLCLTAAVDS